MADYWDEPTAVRMECLKAVKMVVQLVHDGLVDSMAVKTVDLKAARSNWVENYLLG